MHGEDAQAKGALSFIVACLCAACVTDVAATSVPVSGWWCGRSKEGDRAWRCSRGHRGRLDASKRLESKLKRSITFANVNGVSSFANSPIIGGLDLKLSLE